MSSASSPECAASEDRRFCIDSPMSAWPEDSSTSKSRRNRAVNRPKTECASSVASIALQKRIEVRHSASYAACFERGGTHIERISSFCRHSCIANDPRLPRVITLPLMWSVRSCSKRLPGALTFYRCRADDHQHGGPSSCLQINLDSQP